MSKHQRSKVKTKTENVKHKNVKIIFAIEKFQKIMRKKLLDIFRLDHYISDKKLLVLYEQI
jgi:hypothetical protein